jgi:predicted dehydrogenase
VDGDEGDLGPVGDDGGDGRMIRVGVVGLGKMGLSHLSMIRAHPDVTVGAVVDSTAYLLDILAKYTAAVAYSNYEEMLDTANVDAVIIATPTKYHFEMVEKALDRGIHVFCEKPLCLTSKESLALADLANRKSLVNQVGYHNRFVGTFQEVHRLLQQETIGRVSRVLVEAYGPVVLKAKGSTWRSRKSEGGGCLYDYAAHPVDLLTWYLGAPAAVGGTALGKVFSAETHDQVSSTLFFPGGATGQLSVDWSDESYRKMTTRVTVWGSAGRIFADRQECQVYLRDTAVVPAGYTSGWNVRYTTDLTDPVWFYLRGEEYSAQLDHFVQRAMGREVQGVNTFASAAITDRILEMLTTDDGSGPTTFQNEAPLQNGAADAVGAGRSGRRIARRTQNVAGRFRAAAAAFRSGGA